MLIVPQVLFTVQPHRYKQRTWLLLTSIIQPFTAPHISQGTDSKLEGVLGSTFHQPFLAVGSFLRGSTGTTP